MLFEWSNPESWPSKLGNRPYVDEPVDESLVDVFLSQYKRVRAFHSCRTDNLTSYLERGITLSCYADLESYLVNLAKSELNFEIPRDTLHKVSAILGNYHEGSCFAVLDKDRLLHTAAHYSIYGNERLLALVNHLENEGVPISRELLTRRGIPTVFILDLNVDDLSKSDLSALVREINNHIYYDNASASLDFTFQLKRPIPPDRIVGHEHPSTLRDPINQYREYTIGS